MARPRKKPRRTVAIVLRQLRERAQLTQKQLAEILGLSHWTVQEWEKEGVILTPDRLDSLLDAVKGGPTERFQYLAAAGYLRKQDLGHVERTDGTDA